jgi:hypothetical protein
MRLAVDSWAPGFGTAMGDDLQPAPGSVDVNAEVPAADWAPRQPTAATAAADVRFVDGVRRIDARVWAIDESDGTTRPAIAVSYAAGTVRTDGQAVVERCEVRRMLFGPAGMPPLQCGPVVYTPFAVAGTDDQALIGGVQQRMGQLEIEVATSAAPPVGLTVVDGPLSGRQNVPGAVGYVKTHHYAYLPPVVNGVVAALQPGERTPLFVTQTSWSRWSWYLRLPYGAGHPWAGIVRLEASADLDLAQVQHLADTTAATLPRFASHPHRDPRAPQNLYPIGGLERELKRHLGDARYLERVLRQAAAGQLGARPSAASAASPTAPPTSASSPGSSGRST